MAGFPFVVTDTARGTSACPRLARAGAPEGTGESGSAMLHKRFAICATTAVVCALVTGVVVEDPRAGSAGREFLQDRHRTADTREGPERSTAGFGREERERR